MVKKFIYCILIKCKEYKSVLASSFQTVLKCLKADITQVFIKHVMFVCLCCTVLDSLCICTRV